MVDSHTRTIRGLSFGVALAQKVHIGEVWSSWRRGTSKIDPGSVLDNRGENNDDNADKHVEGSDSDTNGSMVVAKDNVEALEEKDDDTDVEYHGFDDLDYATNALVMEAGDFELFL